MATSRTVRPVSCANVGEQKRIEDENEDEEEDDRFERVIDKTEANPHATPEN